LFLYVRMSITRNAAENQDFTYENGFSEAARPG